MLFNSAEFAIFLAIVFGVYLLLRRKSQNVMLLLASYLFYGWWDWRFLSLLWISTITDFIIGRALDRQTEQRKRKALLATSVTVNIGMLGIFKYFDFFASNMHSLLTGIGIGVQPWMLQIVLPVGISFYTFQTLSYTIDIYRGKTKPTRSLLDFALFVAFFPQLVAGPIERARNLLPQMATERRVTWAGIRVGGWLIFWGLYKKIFVADNLARYVDAVYASPQEYSGPMIVLATYAFAIQIYCDFSGYTDIARGVARCMGFQLMENFRLPYLSRDPSEHWRRWHISLSEWLRDYLYFSLGGNRGTRFKVMRNLMITMILGGLWHGAEWNFVLWGVFHAVLLVAYRILALRREAKLGTSDPPGGRLRTAWAILVMFHWTCLGYLIFRIERIQDLVPMLLGIFKGWGGALESAPTALAILAYSALMIVIQVFQWRSGNMQIMLKWPLAVRIALYLTIYFSLTLGGAIDARQFIYFQF